MVVVVVVVAVAVVAVAEAETTVLGSGPHQWLPAVVDRMPAQGWRALLPMLHLHLSRQPVVCDVARAWWAQTRAPSSTTPQPRRRRRARRWQRRTVGPGVGRGS